MAEEIKQFNEELDLSVEKIDKKTDTDVKTLEQKLPDEKIAFKIDELKRVIRPSGQASDYGTRYGQAFWQDDTQTLTALSTIQPYGAMVPISAGSAVVMVSNPTIADGVAGQFLILKGTSNTNTITLKDGNGMKLAGACVLGLNDTLTVYYDGTDWVEVARTNWVSSTTSVSTSSVSTSSSSSSSVSSSSSSSSSTTT